MPKRAIPDGALFLLSSVHLPKVQFQCRMAHIVNGKLQPQQGRIEGWHKPFLSGSS